MGLLGCPMVFQRVSEAFQGIRHVPDPPGRSRGFQEHSRVFQRLLDSPRGFPGESATFYEISGMFYCFSSNFREIQEHSNSKGFQGVPGCFKGFHGCYYVFQGHSGAVQRSPGG